MMDLGAGGFVIRIMRLSSTLLSIYYPLDYFISDVEKLGLCKVTLKQEWMTCGNYHRYIFYQINQCQYSFRKDLFMIL